MSQFTYSTFEISSSNIKAIVRPQGTSNMYMDLLVKTRLGMQGLALASIANGCNILKIEMPTISNNLLLFECTFIALIEAHAKTELMALAC